MEWKWNGTNGKRKGVSVKEKKEIEQKVETTVNKKEER